MHKIKARSTVTLPHAQEILLLTQTGTPLVGMGGEESWGWGEEGKWWCGGRTYRTERGENPTINFQTVVGKIYCGDVQVFFHPRWRLYTSATLCLFLERDQNPGAIFSKCWGEKKNPHKGISLERYVQNIKRALSLSPAPPPQLLSPSPFRIVLGATLQRIGGGDVDRFPYCSTPPSQHSCTESAFLPVALQALWCLSSCSVFRSRFKQPPPHINGHALFYRHAQTWISSKLACLFREKETPAENELHTAQREVPFNIRLSPPLKKPFVWRIKNL